MKIAHRRSGLSQTERSRRDGGYVLVKFALLLVPLLLMSGFSVDVGSWYNRAADIQKAADAAALAGVVFLPNLGEATIKAREAATQNGFTDGIDDVEVRVEPAGERRLKVTIRDTEVESFIYNNLGGRNIDLSRTGIAEYVLAVPMGSPRNYFGTGTVLSRYTAAGVPAEYLYNSVDNPCSNKVNGDRYQSRTVLKTGNGSGDTSRGCTSASAANAEFREDGYSMYIEARVGRPADIEVRLYDPWFNNTDVSWNVPDGQTCTTPTIAWSPSSSTWQGPPSNSGNGIDITINGMAQYQTRTRPDTNTWTSTTTLNPGQSIIRGSNLIRYRTAATTWNPSNTGWIGPSGSTTSITVHGPAQYRTRTSTSPGATYSGVTTLAPGASFSRAGNLLQYREATVAMTTPVCTPKFREIADVPIDDVRATGTETFRYRLFSADDTPLDDDDNPLLCDQTFSTSTSTVAGNLVTTQPSANYEFLGSRRWTNFCTIPKDALPGRYVLRITNSGVGAFNRGNASPNSNNWGIVARYTNASGDGLCDGRTDTLCPRVYGRDAISVRATTTVSEASFYLAEIDRIHDGKQVQLELWDPGEGGRTIEIMKPSGDNTWTPATFSWAADGAGSGNNVTSLNVSSTDILNGPFNGRLVRISIDLDSYNPPANNQWWQIRYRFSTGEAVVDRTTWSARITGDPVHLVEEEAP